GNNTSALTMEGETQYAEYNPKSNIWSETEIDKRLSVRTSTLCMTQVISPTIVYRQIISFITYCITIPVGQKFTYTKLTAFSSHHYKGGFDQNMTKNEASLILGISPTSTKSKVRDAHRRIMVLNHPDKGQFNPKVLDMINYRLDIAFMCLISLLLVISMNRRAPVY
uniref:DnaJ (Hsp40) homolog, subfamily C, member 15 n=1 Tax=Salmo trutta TaxID=8032 RepID=A0A674CKS3_SALTR